MKTIILMTASLFMINLSHAYKHQDLMDALKKSDELAVQLEDYPKAKETVELFNKVFSTYQKQTLASELGNLYAEDAFLNDRIHSVQGVKGIKKYFDGTFKKISKAEFNILDVAYGKKDAYIRWEMVLYFRSLKVTKNLGMSQLRFNTEGKIIYHQDHWDYSEILQQMPLIRNVINTIKNNS